MVFKPYTITRHCASVLISLFLLASCSLNPTTPGASPTSAAVPTSTVTASATRPLKITFINVGQGDAEFLTLPNGKTALIDGGPSNSKISTFMMDHAVTHIDYVVLTHPHSDHYQGLNWVFKNCQVDHFYDTRMNNSGASGDETLRAKAAAEPGCVTTYPASGDILTWDPSVTVKVLHAFPTPSSATDGTVINDSSIVLKITYNGKSALFTGDLDTDLETSLINTYGTELAASVLKVAHHGSQYASSAPFLKLVHPARAYIEVDAAHNTYGHPNADALARLTAAGATIYRTDISGTMEYIFK